MIFSKSKKVWLPKLKSMSSSTKGNYATRRKDVKEDCLCEKPNVNEEYKEVFRTQSYMEILSKVQVLVPQSPKQTSKHNHSSSSSSSSSSNLNYLSSTSSPSTSYSSPLPFYSDLLLEPLQESLTNIIKSSKLQTLLMDYFDASLEACNTCESLLISIQKTRLNHRRIQRVIRLSQGGNNNQQCIERAILQDLASYANLTNPLSNTNNDSIDFPRIREKYAFLLRKLTTKGKKLKKKEKFTQFYKKLVKYGFTISYTMVAITLLGLSNHSMVGLQGRPKGALLSFSKDIVTKLRNYINCDDVKMNVLKHLGEQLDVAARGIYIFINDFDTVERLVTRLHDEVEHRREIAAVCVRNEKCHEVMREALRDIHMHEQGFEEQLQELEEHIYLCFLTINRSRRLVIQQILSPLNS
ncbi:UPF0496 protein At1g20180-like [Amaranthus tricolor]|uniref:UPF0496 protein At1g20180-like n=1 Tax=Amaranthus tricolor TaxID=29722 RepID=UPI00258F66EA|nr:UPF0496 protein At1g20180-like [Amaranthus tricolor]